MKIQKQIIRWNALLLSLVLLSSPIITVAETLAPSNQVSEEMEISEDSEEIDEELEETGLDGADLLDEREMQEDNSLLEATVDEELAADSLREATQELLRNPLDKQQYPMNSDSSYLSESEALNFSFDVQTFQGVINQTYIFSFSSNKSANEVLVRVPKSARIVEEFLSGDEKVEHSHGEYWLLITNTPKTKFNLPLIFQEIGGEFISINHDEDQMFINITHTNKQTPDNLSIIQASEASLEIPQELWDKEEERIFSQIPVSEDINGLNTTVSNWSQFRSAWNNASTSIITSTVVELTPSGLNPNLNTRSSSITLTNLRINTSAQTLVMSGSANLTLDNLARISNISTDHTVINHTGTGAINIRGGSVVNVHSSRNPTIIARTINAEGYFQFINSAGIAIQLIGSNSSLNIQNLSSHRSFIFSAYINGRILKPIQGPEDMQINLFEVKRMAMHANLNFNPSVAPLASWHTVSATISGIDGSTVLYSESDPDDFSERYTETFQNPDYNLLVFNASDSEWVNPPTALGEVIVEHVDSKGNHIIESEKIIGNIGEEYRTEAKEIEGWMTKSIPSNASGTFSESPITVTYVYEETRKVFVYHIDRNGQKLAESEELNGIIGEEYQTFPQEIENYQLVEIPNNAIGVFSEEDIDVTYIYDTVSIPPLDPLDPDKEVNPDNPPVLPEDQGLVSIDFVSQFNFGEVPIQAGKATYEALPQRLLNENGTANTEEERPNYVQISDRRNSEDRGGWSLMATLENEGFKNDAGESLRGAEIQLTNQELAKPSINTGSDPSIVQTTGAVLSPGNSTRLLDASAIEGQGTWIYRFGNQDSAGSSVKLAIPAGANPKATSYKATINWELSAVPGNG